MEPTTEPKPSKRHQFLERLSKLRDTAEAKVRANPLAALAAVFGVGLLIGLAPRRGLTKLAMLVAGQLLTGDLAAAATELKAQ